MAATLMFLNIAFDGKSVVGESTAKDYAERIEIESFSWGIKVKDRDETPRESQARVTKSVLLPERLEIEKFYDSSSHVLLGHMRDGKKFERAVIHYVDPPLVDGQPFAEIMTLTVNDGFVEDVKLQTSGSGKAMAAKETVTLSFRQITLKYRPRKVQMIRDERAAALSFTYEQQGQGI